MKYVKILLKICLKDFNLELWLHYNQHQLDEAAKWWSENRITDSDSESLKELFSTTFDSAQLDEKGKPLDEKGRDRLKMAIRVLTYIHISRS